MLLLSLVTSAAHAQGRALTEADVVRIARERDPGAAVAERFVAVARAREIEAGLYPNPAFEWSREELFGNTPTPEDAFSLALPIELGGSRGARAALARSETETARSSALLARSDAVVRALALFYDAIAAERRREIAERTTARLDEASRVLARREEEGATSGYERVRVELEAELARSRSREVTARASVARMELALLLGIDPARVELRGDLDVRDPATRRDERQSLRRARAALAEADAARSRARFAWFPDLSIAGGYRTGAGDPMLHGYSATLSLELPIFSRGQELVAAAAAEVELRRAEIAVTERASRVASQRATAELALARDELARFDAAMGDRVERLERAAAAGYREGQRSVIELVDVERAREAVEQRRLDLALAAKRAEIALRAARGELE